MYINSRNPNQSLLALAVLDYLVKHCGYAIHLQISTKEFLNELVRRFPERPPMVVGRVMGRILEMIHEWKNTICVTSKYKDDLVHIRDMHRLLSYKGYRFKAFDAARAMANSNPNENLKSPEELEEEDRAAKSAKLQELIRRGTPRDLAAAQELMKYLAGAEPDKTVDYEKETLKELEKVQSKAVLLNDMLDNAKEDERIGVEGDVYDQVAAACKGARPKIQRWIETDTGEHEGLMDKLLVCNDLINAAIERFEAAKRGDWSAARNITVPQPGAAAGSQRSGGNDLISFDAFADDDEQPSGGLALPSGSQAAPSTTNPGFTAGGLPLDLFATPSPSGSPAPGPSTSSGPSQPRKDPMAFFNQPSQPSQPVQPQPQYGGLGGLGSLQTSTPPVQSQSPFFQQSQPTPPLFGGSQPSASASPAGGNFPGYSVPTSSNGFSSPSGFPAQQQPAQSTPQAQQQQQQQPKKNDAFADLVDLMG